MGDNKYVYGTYCNHVLFCNYSNLGTINFIIKCENVKGTCGNWTLDLKNRKLIENNINQDINASAKITS